MQFSKFAVLLASASALAAPLDLEAGIGNAPVSGNALVARQNAAIGADATTTITLGVITGLIPALNGVLGTLLNALGLPTALLNQLPTILSQVRTGIDPTQVQILAQTQSRLSNLGRQLTTTEAALLVQVNAALALVGRLAGTLVGTGGASASQLAAIIATLPAETQAAITRAIAFFNGVIPTFTVGNTVTVTRTRP